ncbi:TetR/AcrR family transcriptional regulator [Mycobacterium timonense]|jgi:TetR/AcrR family transcriptional regulator|uniref:TetR/AcrR family transcriptional regulator n=1 Tax=Mycobacterium timonense TaxID=701043 RepID=UPI0013D3DED0
MAATPHRAASRQLAGAHTPSRRAQRTRASIVDASRRLFLERGYADTTVRAITIECGLSRPRFYVYFKDRQHVFETIGETAYRDMSRVLRTWRTFSKPLADNDVRHFVAAFFTCMDHYDGFTLFSAESAPRDDMIRRGRARLETDMAGSFGQALALAGGHAPEVIGSCVLGMLAGGWHCSAHADVKDRRDTITALADIICRLVDSEVSGLADRPATGLPYLQPNIAVPAGNSRGFLHQRRSGIPAVPPQSSRREPSPLSAIGHRTPNSVNRSRLAHRNDQE